MTLTIPKSPREITAAWLTQALRSTGTIRNSSVKSFEMREGIGEGSGFIGILARLTLRYDRPEEGAPASLIVKQPAVDPGGREVGNLFRFYEREARFYDEIAGEIDVRTPRCYYNAMDLEEGDFILLLEDLSPARCGDQLESCSPEEMRLAVTEIAKLHATWWDSPRLEQLSWMPYINDPVQLFAHTSYAKAWPGFSEFAKGKVPGSLMEIGELLLPKVASCLHDLASTRGPLTIVHGDFRLDNIFFDTDGGQPCIAVIDWQISSRGRGIFDVAYFMTGNIDPAIRKAEEMDVLRMYQGILQERGASYEWDGLLRDYRLSALFCLVYNVIGLGTLDTANDRGVAMWEAWLSRTSAAIHDLNAVELLPA